MTQHITNATGELGGNTSISLRTLVTVRWVAIIGQILAVLLSSQVLGLQFPLLACIAIIAVSALTNVVISLARPMRHRLSSVETLVMLHLDLVQLTLLLALTGGMNNPFALLLMAPVAIGAASLAGRLNAIVWASTVTAAGLLHILHLPIRLADGQILHAPALLEHGYLLAIVVGASFIAAYVGRVAAEIRDMSQGLLATQMALARAQKLTDLGGVVAAAAHELGTPLATIKLVSAEMIDELSGHPELGDLRDDATLIREQAIRCSAILHSMGEAGKDDLHMRQAPLQTVLEEAGEPHADRGIRLVHNLHPAHGHGPEVLHVQRTSEILHGLRNFIQNAVDFASTTVWIDAAWDDRQLVVTISDDGPGYPPHLLGRIGDPFLRARADESPERPGYDGMGLGLFIAKTLIERTGAKLDFRNGGDPFLVSADQVPRSGAVVEIRWPLAMIQATPGEALGENAPILR